MSTFIDELLETTATETINTVSKINFSKQQKAGKISKSTLKNTPPEDNINKLLSMLTTETITEQSALLKTMIGGNKNDTIESINTEQLENKLLSLLGNNNNLNSKYIKENYNDNIFINENKVQNGGEDINAGVIKHFFDNLKSKGVNVDIKLNNQTFTEYFNMNATTTNINNTEDITSTANILNNKLFIGSENNIISATSDANMSTIFKGGQKPINKTPPSNIIGGQPESFNKSTPVPMTSENIFSATSDANMSTILKNNKKSSSKLTGGQPEPFNKSTPVPMTSENIFSATSDANMSTIFKNNKNQPHIKSKINKNQSTPLTSEINISDYFKGGKNPSTPLTSENTLSVQKIINNYELSETSLEDLEINQEGGKGPNPGFQAFLNLKSHIAKKLNISNGPIAGKVAGVVQSEAKVKFPNLDSIKLSEEAIKHFEKNMNKYKEIAEEAKNNPTKRSKKIKKIKL